MTDATGYQYDKLDRLIQVKRPSGQTIVYTYDARGNRKTLKGDSLIEDSNEQTYTFNVWDQLKSVAKENVTTEFEYEMQGLRLSKATTTTPGSGSGTGTPPTPVTEKVRYAYNNSGQVISESDASNRAIANYVWGPDRMLAKRDVATNKKYYYLYNGHGDVVQIVDENGTKVNSYQYDEWGNILAQEEGIRNSFKYAGEIQDPETGLYYLRARYYNPETGRFVGKDTFEGSISNPLSLNFYTYAENNPLILVDPSGNVAIGVSSLLWKINGLINEQKIKWMQANDSNNKTEMKAASSIAQNIRTTYSFLSGLLQPKDPYQTVHYVQNSDSSKVHEVRITQTGNVLFEKQSGYEYYVESHKTTKSDKAQAVAGRVVWDGVVGYTSSRVLKWAGLEKNKKLVDGAVTVGGAVIGNYIVDVYTSSPSVGEERHIIWRTNIKTGEISNLVVVTDGRKVIEDRYWYITKKGK